LKLGKEGYLYLTLDNIWVIKSRRWAGHVALMGQRRGAYWVSAGRPERDHLEDTGTDGRTLKRIFRKWDGEAWTGLIWLRIKTGGGRF
jgi:hypothetical protein